MRPTLAALAAVLAVLLGACGKDDPDAPATTAKSVPSGDADLFAYDASAPLDPVEGATTSGPAIRVQDLTYTTFDDTEVHAVLAQPMAENPPYRCLIYQGGLEYSATQEFFLERPFIATRYQVLSIDPRFAGEQPAADAQAFIARREPEVLREAIQDSVIDLRRAIDYLESRPDCEEGIGYIGVSFGGILGALVGGADDRIAAAALIAAGGDWRALLRGTDVVLPRIEADPAAFGGAIDELDPLDPVRWVGGIAPNPLLMINGRNDTTVVPDAARALHAAAGEPSDVVWYPGGHDPFTGPWAKRVTASLVAFLASELGI